MERERSVKHAMVSVMLVSWMVGVPTGGFAQGNRSERPGDAMSNPSMNQPKSTYEKQATDMTGGEEGLVGRYDVEPVRQGKLVDEKGGPLDQIVKNKKGEVLGTIEKLLKDTKTGKVEYAVLELEESKYQLPLQWSQFKQEGGKLTLNASKADLYPIASSVYSKDLSPDVSQYMDQINKVRSEPKPKSGNAGAQQRPTPADPGDSSIGGYNPPSGIGALPPGPAPGHEGEHPSSKR